MDKFTYTTTYKQEFCARRSLPGNEFSVEKPVKEGDADCRGVFIPGVETGLPPDPKSLRTCPCQPGGLLPPRGERRNQGDGRCNGPPWLRQRGDERRDPDLFRINRRPPRAEVPDVIHGEEARSREGRRPTYQQQGGRRRANASRSDVRIPGPFWIRQRRDEGREIECPRRRKFEKHTEARDVIHGGEPYNGGRCRPQSKTRIPGPFWMKERPDLRREPDIDRRRRIERRGEIPDVIHGEERRGREWRETRDRRGEERQGIDPYKLPPGPSNADPFWVLERADERRNPDMDKKRKYERKPIKAAEIVHGEDFRTRYDQPRREELPRVLGPDPIDETFESDEDDAEPFPFRKPCECGTGLPKSGPDTWMREHDWGNARHGRAGIVPGEEEDSGGRPPAARISCAPQAEVAQVDQPSAFMRQLYKKYPYLYQVLRETPPEELASRVFKDKFLSTYQVDFLHMGVGQERIPEGGAQVQERMTGPDGEPEPQAIPGCSYRHGERGDFGRKKHEDHKSEKEAPPEEETREEPRISEYQATISRLGGEIITDQLYKVAQITKSMKNTYKKM